MAKEKVTGNPHISVTTTKNGVSASKIVNMVVEDGKVVADSTENGVKQ